MAAVEPLALRAILAGAEPVAPVEAVALREPLALGAVLVGPCSTAAAAADPPRAGGARSS